MKKVLKITAALWYVLFASEQLLAQPEEGKDSELYSKAHIAFTNFKIVGVNSAEYAKCVEAANYLDPEKTPKFLLIGETVFADDGKQFDLRAGDGILTSTQLFKYTESSTPAAPGQYRPSKTNIVVYDQSFVHIKNQDLEGKFRIDCNIVWVPCSQMTGAQQALCKIIGWPWGIFILKDCKIGWG